MKYSKFCCSFLHQTHQGAAQIVFAEFYRESFIIGEKLEVYVKIENDATMIVVIRSL